jgi:hypothetical protein
MCFDVFAVWNVQRLNRLVTLVSGAGMKPLKRQFGTEMDGGFSYTLRAGPGAKPYIDIGVSWTIHSDREASLQMCWGGRPLTTLENAEAFYEAFGEMLKVAKTKRFQLGTRNLI